jgi:hypothetical protein
MTVKLFAPTGRTGIVQASASGTTYTIAADGSVSVDSLDVPALERAGFTTASRDGQASNGLGTIRIPLVAGKNSDGSVLTASPASGKFGVSLTAGTSEALTSETAQSNTKTDVAYFETVLPPSYVAGQDITLTVNAKVSGTLTTKTIAAAAYKVADAGTQGSTLIATAAQAMTTSAADYAFTITGTTLSPGDRLGLLLTMVLTEAAAATQTGTVNSLRLS